MTPPPLPDAFALDQMQRLPAEHRRSILLVLAVAGLNAFNDNILKMMLVGLAPKVVEGALGTNIGAWLGAMILLPYILFAPLAGYLADRFSKRSVIIAMLIAQAAILLLTGLCFHSAMGRLSIDLALGCFFLLALQSTIFSPAKMGIMKELAGSRRLGVVAGWLQMMTMLGILGGLWLGGEWYDYLFAEHHDAWWAAAHPIWVLFGISMVALVAGFSLQRTPSHPQTEFRKSLLWQHFRHLNESFQIRGIRRAFMGNAAYWFVASMVAAMFVDIGLSLHPDRNADGAASAASHMTLMVGIGTALGSVLVSWINRRGLQLGIVPLAALGLADTLFWAGSSTPGGTAFNFALVAIGIAGGCYLVPLQAYIQDRADPAKRGRVLSAMNLLDSLAGVVAVGFLLGLKYLGFGFGGQFWSLAVLMLGATVYIVKILPHDLLRFVVVNGLRSFYKLRILHADRVPATGGVLLLPNHVSYLDALLIGAACNRRVRFVMWDVLYNVWWMNWFLKMVGTVPISATRAKDAIRTVATALKEGEVVCLFPEGQITRHGMINELRKGFELMARQADVPVVTAHTDGMYGSIFSYEGGVCFTKLPKRLRYPVTVQFGHPKGSREASVTNVRAEMEVLNRDAFLARPIFNHSPLPDAWQTVWGPEVSAQMLANALRLAEIEWVLPGDAVLSLGSDSHAIYRTLAAFSLLKNKVTHLHGLDALEGSKAKRVFAVGSVTELQGLAVSAKWMKTGAVALCWQHGLTEETRLALEAQLQKPVYQGCLDESSGALVTSSVPDPKLPDVEKGNQLGFKAGTFGRLLPGLSAVATPDGLEITGLRPGAELALIYPNAELDEDGFVKPAPPAK